MKITPADIVLSIGAFAMLIYSLGEPDRERDRMLSAFRDGKAQVIEYSVPGQGMCRAVVLDGKRHVEACEEGPRAQSHD